jgi:hypothetical protein
MDFLHQESDQCGNAGTVADTGFFRQPACSCHWRLVHLGGLRRGAGAANAGDNGYTVKITTVKDTEWRMDESTQERLIEFEHNPARLRVLGQCLGALDHFRHQPLPDLRHPFLRAPTPCISSRSRTADSARLMTVRGMVLFEAESRPGPVEGNLAPCIQIRQTCKRPPA